ncbi:MAG: hypothetical protein AB9891_22095 [Anaerolineaceae bacterium]
MPKQFYTEHEIEDMVKQGIQSLELNDNVVMTELAYEKAGKLGLKLVRAVENPPSAPVRPYIARESQTGRPALAGAIPASGDLHTRVREAVVARLGKQVDPALLDTIITRSLKAVGLNK